MPRPSVRRLEADDLPAVTVLERAVFGDPWSRRSFEEMLSLDHVRGLVALDEAGTLVGYAICSSVEDEGEILNLAVAAERRRSGVGRALLDGCLEWLTGRGVARVFLEVRRSNAAALAMYGAAGFETLGLRPNYYRKPTEDAVTMGLQVGVWSARK